jgi:branched-chain amino acid transport system substrate-binding protein
LRKVVGIRGALCAVALVAAVALVVAGCGGSSKKQKTTSAAPASTAPSTPATTGSKSPIRVAVLSDCQGAFGAFDNQDLAGVVAAMSEYAGARPKDPSKPRAGWTGGAIGGHPLKLVGIGCSNDKADTAIKETRRLMEQLKADVMIGPLSGDESIAVANYAKQHPDKTFVDGSAGAQDTTLKVRAPNFFRFNGDGAQWNAGLGDLAYNKLGWKTAAVIADDYSFAWTSAAGFIAEFCAAGGKVTKRVFPPLNTTDYSSFAQQLPSNVDGTFVAVGGAGLIPFLKAYQQAHGTLDGKKFIGNLFWSTPGLLDQLGGRVAGAYAGGAGTAGDLASPAAQNYAKNIIGKWFKAIPGAGPDPAPVPQAASTFTYGYYANTWGLIEGLKAAKGDISGGQKALQAALGKVKLDGPYGPVTLDKNRQAIINVYYAKLALNNGKIAANTVAMIPNVDQTFGGTFSETTPAPGRTFPPCVKRSIPWLGKAQKVQTVSG